jgi:uracil-DNA glycosylase family 4
MANHLDLRHIAMLAEMGVTVWQPAVPQADALKVQQQDRIPPASIVSPVAPSGTAGKAMGSGGGGHPIPVQPGPSLPLVSDNLKPTARADHATMGWQDLQTCASSCTDCRLGATRGRSIWGRFVGNADPSGVQPAPQVRVLVVTDPPDELDERAGLPFGGPDAAAGQLVDNMLAAAGLLNPSRPGVVGAGAVFVTNLTKCKVPSGTPLAAGDVASCSAYLHRQIALLQPALILTLGRAAAQAMVDSTAPPTGTRALGVLRGSVHRYAKTPVVVSFSPHYLLRNPMEKAKAWEDLCLALAQMTAQAGDDAAAADIKTSHSG